MNIVLIYSSILLILIYRFLHNFINLCDHIKPARNVKAICNLIEKTKSDIVLLQEVIPTSEKLLEELDSLAPYGQGNHEPILGIKKVRLASKPRKVGSGEHFQFSIHNGTYPVSGIAWRMAGNIPSENEDIDIAFRLQWNTWNQKRKLQMVMEAWQ